jgi:hypothetical protein
MRCIPGVCPSCESWGPSVPGKVRCMKDAAHWFSTTEGAECQRKGPLQDSLFDTDEDDDSRSTQRMEGE